MTSATKGKGRTKVDQVRPAGPRHQVLTLSTEGGHSRYRRKPCGDCPWRKDAIGVFPAEAFGHSARTAYDMAKHVFSCHAAGAEQPSTCAGFLLRGADHNLTVRLKRMSGSIADDVSDGGHALHDSYRAMAIANGLDPSDPRLADCRDD